MTLTAEQVLPVELSVLYRPRRSQAQTSWSGATALEENFSHYELQRSADGEGEWTVLDKIMGANAGAMEGQKSYAWTDEVPATRQPTTTALRSVDLDGSYSMSRVVFLTQAATGDMQVFPNPTNGRITVSLPRAEPLSLRITDVNGKVLRSGTVTGGRYEDTLDLPGGVYLLTVTSGTERWTGAGGGAVAAVLLSTSPCNPAAAPYALLLSGHNRHR